MISSQPPPFFLYLLLENQIVFFGSLLERDILVKSSVEVLKCTKLEVNKARLKEKCGYTYEMSPH